MLTNEQAHSLVEHIRGGSDALEPVDVEAIQELLGRPHSPNRVWDALQAGARIEWAGGWVNLETMAALLFELAGRCPGIPEGKHRLYEVAYNHHDDCEYCGVKGDVARSLDTWSAHKPALHK